MLFGTGDVRRKAKNHWTIWLQRSRRRWYKHHCTGRRRSHYWCHRSQAQGKRFTIFFPFYGHFTIFFVQKVEISMAFRKLNVFTIVWMKKWRNFVLHWKKSVELFSVLKTRKIGEKRFFFFFFAKWFWESREFKWFQLPFKWSNPSGDYHVGVVYPYSIYPSKLTEKITAERKKRYWDDGQKTALAEATRKLQVRISSRLKFRNFRSLLENPRKKHKFSSISKDSRGFVK